MDLLRKILVKLIVVLEFFPLVIVALGFISGPIAFYVLGVIYNLKEGFSLWWLIGLPCTLFIPVGIFMLVSIVSVLGEKTWKKSRKK